MNGCSTRGATTNGACPVRSISSDRRRSWRSRPRTGTGRATTIRTSSAAGTGPSITGPAQAFEPVARFGASLLKLVPTEWGAPTFEIDGVKMLPTRHVSPYEDARRKVELVGPRDQRVLDTCAGLGYFAAWCLAGGAAQVQSFEINPAVLWLRSLNPWSPPPDPRLVLTQGDISESIAALPDRAFGAILHDPPRFGLAGELYSQAFYDHLARVLQPKGRLFHYTGEPNRLTSGRDVPQEVAKRLRHAGFSTQFEGDGVLGLLAPRRRR